MRAASSRIYFDYAATSPLDPAVRQAMAPYFGSRFGNPGSLHYFGQEAVAAVDSAREKIAAALALDVLAGFREIIFTGSATEANNLALRASAKNFKNPRMLVSAIEHESVLETARLLAEDGWIDLVVLPVGRDGVVDLKFLKKNLTVDTALVSVMWANNETGVVQPVFEISKIIFDFKKQIASSKSPIFGNEPLAVSHWPLFHVDAVQAFQYIDCSPAASGIDLMTLSAHKICGPKGIGALYVRSGVFGESRPIIAGGGQEFGWRSGTENVPLIAGFGRAAELAAEIRDKEKKRIGDLRDFFWRELKKIFPKAKLNGRLGIPNILNIEFPGLSAEELLIRLDMAGIAVSSGSACSARAVEISHVLKTMGLPEKSIKSSLRFSFGRFTAKSEIQNGLRRLRSVLRLSPE